LNNIQNIDSGMNIKAIIYRLSGYKTFEELFLELKKGKRQTIESKTAENARKLEDALLPKGLIFPKGGEVYEALHDVEINYLTYFMAPYSGGDKAILPKGERVIIHTPKKQRPIGYYCTPINYGEIEKAIIPAATFDDPAYTDYSLSVKTLLLNKDFKQIALNPITYVKGDATDPTGAATRIIVHICNDIGGWGKGFVTAISNKWKQPEAAYRDWFTQQELVPTETMRFEKVESRDKYLNEKKFELGNVQFVKVTDDIWVANMLAQRDTKPDKDGIPPIRYIFVAQCLERVKQFARKQQASVHMPRIGCGLAGGQWAEIEPIINKELIAHEIETTVYDFE
jgi:O-acetyl-ADP-ribose deacetylase (regulator of RNase III)